MTKNAQGESQDEIHRGKDRRYSGQQVRRSPAAHKPAPAAAHAERPALGALQEDNHDHREDGHDVYDEKDSDH